MVQGSLPSTAGGRERGSVSLAVGKAILVREGFFWGSPTYRSGDKAFSGFCSWLSEDRFARSRRIESFHPQCLIQPSPVHILRPTWETRALSLRSRFAEGRARQGCH